ANTWRRRMDLRASDVGRAATVEEQLRIASMPFHADGIGQVATFLAVERILQREIAAALVQEPSENAVSIAEQKQAASFWSQVEDVQPLWALIASAGRLLLEARRVDHMLRNDSFDAAGFVSAYTSGDEPLCNLDAIHRQMELGYHKFTFYPGDEMHDLLGRLVSKAREQYMRVGSALAARFVTAYEQGGFALLDVLRQTQIFDQKVKPQLDAHKVAYVWVDALRFEMARDLIKGLRDDFEITLEPAVAAVPTITVFGMAALLPNAERLRAVVAKDVLIPQIDETRLKDRGDRLKYFRSVYPNLVDAKLSDLVPKPKKSLETNIRNADLVLITSQEIDESGETDAESARLQMDNVLRQLQQALRILVRCGIQTIVLTADHGHLFGETLGDDMRIEAPGGETAALHRRAWIGQGGTQHDAVLRTQLSKLGMNSNLEIVVPYGFGVFPVQGGASRYFHGGLSPQELIIPLLTLTSTLKASAKSNADIQWELKLGAQKLGRFFSVQVTGRSAGLFPPELPTVRAELRVSGKLISAAVSAGYGYDSSTESVQLRWNEDSPPAVEPNTITLMVNADPQRGDVGELLLLDAISGVVLAKLVDLEFAIHM
ncbi:MAG: PglZ domain-containing protein, partial [Anaerolineae bacterium]|nr:PglZ domain-containing protein [Anaerolineae bacterium]